MQLQIKTHNYNMLEGSIPVALIFKIHYKAMFSAFASKHKHILIKEKHFYKHICSDLTP